MNNNMPYEELKELIDKINTYKDKSGTPFFFIMADKEIILTAGKEVLVDHIFDDCLSCLWDLIGSKGITEQQYLELLLEGVSRFVIHNALLFKESEIKSYMKIFEKCRMREDGDNENERTD